MRGPSGGTAVPPSINASDAPDRGHGDSRVVRIDGGLGGDARAIGDAPRSCGGEEGRRTLRHGAAPVTLLPVTEHPPIAVAARCIEAIPEAVTGHSDRATERCVLEARHPQVGELAVHPKNDISGQWRGQGTVTGGTD